MWENCESVYLPTNLQLGCKTTVSTYLPSWRMWENCDSTYIPTKLQEGLRELWVYIPTLLPSKKEMWVYLECTYITTFRGEWESVPCYLSSGGYERTVSLPTFLPAFKGDVREPCLNLSIFEEIRKNFESIYQTTCQPSRGMWENCESHTYLSTFHGDVRKLWVYLPTNLLRGCERTVSSYLSTYLPTFTVHSHPPWRQVDSQVSHMLFWGMWETWVPPSLPTFEWEVKELGFCLPTYISSFRVCKRTESAYPYTYLSSRGMWENSESTYLSTHLHS